MKTTSKRPSKSAKKKKAGKTAKKATKKKTRKTAKKTTKKKKARKTSKKATKKKAVRKAAKKTRPPATKRPSVESAVLKTGAERRVEELHDIPGLLAVQVELMGYGRDARESGIGPLPDPSHRFQTAGTTTNLSTSGMLACVAEKITGGSHCLVRFVDPHGCIKPELRWGLVMRCIEVESEYEVAVSFDVPLEVLDIEGLRAAWRQPSANAP